MILQPQGTCRLPPPPKNQDQPGGVGHCSRDSMRQITCRLSRSDGGHIFR